MTADVIEARDIQTGCTGAWVTVTTFVSGKIVLGLEEAREIAAAIHRYDIAKAHEEASNG